MDLCDSGSFDSNLRYCAGLYLIEKYEKKNRENMRQLQQDIKVGARIMFAGGIYGKIVKIKGDVIDVEINKSTVVQISRYSIQNVITG